MDTTTNGNGNTNANPINNTPQSYSFWIGSVRYVVIFYGKSFQIIERDLLKGDIVILSSFYDKVFVPDGGSGQYNQQRHPDLLGHEILIGNGKEYVYVGKSILSFKMKEKIVHFKADVDYFNEISGAKNSNTSFETASQTFHLYNGISLVFASKKKTIVPLYLI